MHGTIRSLIPFLVVIPLALLTRQVLPGLVIGLLVGAYMLNPTPLGGISTALQYILKELAIPDNLRLIVFMYGFGAFVGLVRITGGVSGFALLMEKKIRTSRVAFLVTWLSSLLTFMAPDFRIITVGPVMKQIFSRLKVPPDKVAFVIDATATPLCAIMPLGTVFIGYTLGLLGTVSRHQGVATTPYTLFLQSIPFNFFSLAMMGFALLYSFRRAEKTEPSHVNEQTPEPIQSIAQIRALGSAKLAFSETSMELAVPLPSHQRGRTLWKESEVAEGSGESGEYGETREAEGSGIHRGTRDYPVSDNSVKFAKSQRSERAVESESFPDPVEQVAQHVPPNALNLLVPLFLLLGLTLFYTWWDGHLRSAGFLGALIQANAGLAMLEALLTVLIISVIWYALQKQPIQRTLFGFMQGGNEMMAVNVLLVFVWAVSAISTDLGFVAYTEQAVGRYVPAAFIAPAFFVIGCLLSYVIGSTFGTWGILMPLGFSLATTEHAALPLIAGAVFASGTFGGFVSPLSDNTVAMAAVMKIPVMDYAKLKLRFGLMVAAFCTVLYGIVGWFYR